MMKKFGFRLKVASVTDSAFSVARPELAAPSNQQIPLLGSGWLSGLRSVAIAALTSTQFIAHMPKVVMPLLATTALVTTTHVAHAQTGTKVGPWSVNFADGWNTFGYATGDDPWKGTNGTRSWSGSYNPATNSGTFTGQGGSFSSTWNSAGGNWIPDISRSAPTTSGLLSTMATNYNIQWNGTGSITPNNSTYTFGLKFNLAAPKADGTSPGWPGYYDLTSSYECYIVTHTNKPTREGRWMGTFTPPGETVPYDCYEWTTDFGGGFKQLYAYRQQNTWNGPVNMQAIVKYWADYSQTSLNYNTWYLNTGLSIAAETFDTAGNFQLNNVRIPDLNTALPLPNIGTGTGLKGDYYSGQNFTTLVKTQTDSTVNFNWGTGSPKNLDGTNMNSVGPDNFGVRWTGQIQALEAGNYTFSVVADDTAKVWINNLSGTPVVNQTAYNGGNPTNGTFTMAAGQKYNIKIDFTEAGGGAMMQLRWKRPGTTTSDIVPQSQLYPVPIVNLITNPSFDAENFDTQTPSGWGEWEGDVNYNSIAATSSYTESAGGSSSGARHGTHFKNAAHRVYTYQTKTGLANGLYTVRAYARRTGNHATCYLEAVVASATKTVNIPVSSTYQLIEIKDVNVTDGNCKIGFWTVGGANDFSYFDDVTFFKQ